MNSIFGASVAAMALLTFNVGCGDDEPALTTAANNNGGMGGSTSTNMGGGGSMSNGGTGGSTSTAMGGNGAGGAPDTYPDGPYGNQMGDTFPFLTWEGYLSTDAAALATTETWTDTYTSLDLHGSGAQYALIHTTLSG